MEAKILEVIYRLLPFIHNISSRGKTRQEVNNLHLVMGFDSELVVDQLYN